ncbi:MAG: glycosyltransferase [Gemmatimonadota bacterium]|nr:glycosyltransferase [Gemmatimonadota bacterium]
MRVNLIYHDNGAGTPRTAGIVANVLAQAGAITTHSVTPRPSLARWASAVLGRAVRRPHYDLNIFLEQVRPRWLPSARRNVLVPNQEWFDPSWLPHLPAFDLVLTKTRYAEQRFRALGATVSYIGFTSEDRRMRPAPPPVDGVLHLAGRSLQKGTDAILEVWSRRPDWPTLTVVQRPPHPGYPLDHPELPNVVYRTDRVPDSELQQLQNAHQLHLCPSLAEGFGHTLVESMSCGAVLITTDGPPMNELVQPDRGILVAAKAAERQGVGQLYRADPQALEGAIDGALRLPAEERERLGVHARTWFEVNDAAFRNRLRGVLGELG